MIEAYEAIDGLLGDAVTVSGERVRVEREDALEGPMLDALVRAAVFNDEDERQYARWLIWEMGQQVGVRPASIHELYMARGRGEISGFTVPAMNVRGMTYDTARSIFRTAKKLDAGAFLLEIARSEIAYTDQRPSEYVSVMLAAAMREGFRGPVFIQGDHFQVNVKKYKADPKTEVDSVKLLAREAILSGFYNIDIDTSTLVDLSKESLDEQQRPNYEVAVDILQSIRELEPDGVTISLGAEIGEVGTENSTVEELHAFMQGFNRVLRERSGDVHGISKISVQSGTTHGGVVLPDGTIADVSIDFDTLERLSTVAREDYGLAGAVQHGASTLPDEAFNRFPKVETAEIHLATNFQNILYEQLPSVVRGEIYAWLDEHTKDERKPSDSDEQFYYKTRKKALGPFKRTFWDLPDDVKARLARTYDEKFEFLFRQLAIGGTAKAVAKYVKATRIHRPRPDESTPAIAAAPDDASLSD